MRLQKGPKSFQNSQHLNFIGISDSNMLSKHTQNFTLNVMEHSSNSHWPGLAMQPLTLNFNTSCGGGDREVMLHSLPSSYTIQASQLNRINIVQPNAIGLFSIQIPLHNPHFHPWYQSCVWGQRTPTYPLIHFPPNQPQDSRRDNPLKCEPTH